MSEARTKARRLVVQALYQWQLTGREVDTIDINFINDHDMSKVDVDYFHELLHQIPLHVHELEDHVIPVLDRPIDEVDPVERAVLQLGTYELEFRKDIPYRVVINESVELAKMFGAEHGHKYVNGILDKAAMDLRQEEMTTTKKPKQKKAEIKKKKKKKSTTK